MTSRCTLRLAGTSKPLEDADDLCFLEAQETHGKVTPGCILFKDGTEVYLIGSPTSMQLPAAYRNLKDLAVRELVSGDSFTITLD